MGGFGGPDWHRAGVHAAKKSILYLPRDGDLETFDAVDLLHPLPVVVTGDVTLTPAATPDLVAVTKQVPGIATGAAYADGEALGTLIAFNDLLRPSKRSGRLEAALYYDLDDEGLQVDLHFFSRSITSGTDNSAYNPSDVDMQAYLGTVSFMSFYNLGSNQLSSVYSIDMPLVSDSTTVYAQAVARGALNIAADNIPVFKILVQQH